MSRRFQVLGWALVSLLCGSCLAGFVWTMDYELAATAVRVEGGEEPLEVATPGGGADLECRDAGVAFAIDVHPGGIDARIRNLGSSPVALHWGGARFVDAGGNDLALYAAAAGNEGAAPAVVSPGSEVAVFLWPESWLRTGKVGPAAWRADSPIDGRAIAEPSRADAVALARSHIGRTFEVVLSLEWGERLATYRFRFIVVGLAPKRISWA